MELREILIEYSALRSEHFEKVCVRNSNNNIIVDKILDQFRFLGNCPPTPPLIHHFALSEK